MDYLVLPKKKMNQVNPVCPTDDAVCPQNDCPSLICFVNNEEGTCPELVCGAQGGGTGCPMLACIINS